MDREDLIRRQHEAEKIVASQIWKDAWEGYRLKVFSAIENAKTDEATIRGKLMLGIANDVRAYLEGTIKSGQFAAIELAEKKKRWFA